MTTIEDIKSDVLWIQREINQAVKFKLELNTELVQLYLTQILIKLHEMEKNEDK